MSTSFQVFGVPGSYNAGRLLDIQLAYTKPLAQDDALRYNATLNAWVNVAGGSGGLEIPDGTAASPGLYFTNEVDTGIYRPATDTFGLSVAGVNHTILSRLDTNSNARLSIASVDESSSASFPLLSIGSQNLFNRTYVGASGSSKTFTVELSTAAPGTYCPCIMEVIAANGKEGDSTDLGVRRMTVAIMRSNGSSLNSVSILEDISSDVAPGVDVIDAPGISVSTSTTSVDIDIACANLDGEPVRMVVAVNFIAGIEQIVDIIES